MCGVCVYVCTRAEPPRIDVSTCSGPARAHNSAESFGVLQRRRQCSSPTSSSSFGSPSSRCFVASGKMASLASGVRLLAWRNAGGLARNSLDRLCCALAARPRCDRRSLRCCAAPAALNRAYILQVRNERANDRGLVPLVRRPPRARSACRARGVLCENATYYVILKTTSRGNSSSSSKYGRDRGERAPLSSVDERRSLDVRRIIIFTVA